jgi:CubicO group peptidase (beta-lactamase class C family)
MAPAASSESDIAAKVDPIFVSLAANAAHAPGCVAGVFRAGEVLYAKGYGLANLEYDLPLTPTTTIEIASMSKQFTATAILLLAQDGKLALGDDVRKYIPELPSYGHVLTLRHLLHHTGGLREYDTLLSLSGWDYGDVATDDEALRLVTLQKGTNFVPGTEWSYSNTGYFLLSIVVKRVSGKTLGAFSKERIFDPLAMKDTTIFDDHAMIVRRHATGYSPREATRDGIGFKVNMSGREMTGEGNIQTTLEDLARWDANFYEPKVGGASWLETMRTPGKREDGTALTYAMGLQLRTNHGLREEEHAGGWAGYLSDLRRYPTAKLSVACLCNRDDVDPRALTDAMAKALLPEDTSGAADTPAAEKAGAPAAATDLGTLVGAYLDPESLEVRVFAAKDGKLTIGFGLGSGPAWPLDRLDARTFHNRGESSRWAFEPAAGKKPPRVTRTAAGERTTTFERFEPVTLEASQLAAYAGRYESPEMTSDFEVLVKDGKLQAGPWGKAHELVTLQPLARDAFAADGFAVAFERDGRRKVVGMTGAFDGHRAVRWSKR